MSSINSRIKQIKQPRGGYLNIGMFKALQLPILEELSQFENSKPSYISQEVNNKIAIILNNNLDRKNVDSFNNTPNETRLLSNNPKALDEMMSITNIDALKSLKGNISEYLGKWCDGIGEADGTNLDYNTANNIRIMIERSIFLFRKCGCLRGTNFTFGNAYTNIIDNGTGDYLINDTLWIVLVVKGRPSSYNTLRLLVHYIMSQHSGLDLFDGIGYIGIFNPRLNIAYKMKVSDIPIELIKEVEEDVIGYGVKVVKENTKVKIEDMPEIDVFSFVMGEDIEDLLYNTNYNKRLRGELDVNNEPIKNTVNKESIVTKTKPIAKMDDTANVSPVTKPVEVVKPDKPKPELKYLISAARNGSINDISKLRANYSYTYDDYILAVKCAIENNRLLAVKFIVTKIIQSKPTHEGLLIRAAEVGILNIVKFLIEQKVCNYFELDKALCIASKKGFGDIVMYLVGKGAIISENALVSASISGNVRTLKYLTRKSDVLYTCYKSVMDAAVYNKRGKVIKYLNSINRHNKYSK